MNTEQIRLSLFSNQIPSKKLLKWLSRLHPHLPNILTLPQITHETVLLIVPRRRFPHGYRLLKWLHRVLLGVTYQTTPIQLFFQCMDLFRAFMYLVLNMLRVLSRSLFLIIINRRHNGLIILILCHTIPHQWQSYRLQTPLFPRNLHTLLPLLHMVVR